MKMKRYRKSLSASVSALRETSVGLDKGQKCNAKCHVCMFLGAYVIALCRTETERVKERKSERKKESLLL